MVLLGASLDEALERARKLASLHLTFVSVVGRGPTGSPQPVVAYEITPGTGEREFRQWHGPLPAPVGKTPVSRTSFGGLFEAYVATKEGSTSHAIRMAMQLYAAALREIEPVLRFMLLWPALEVIDMPLRRRLMRKPKDRYWGAECVG